MIFKLDGRRLPEMKSICRSQFCEQSVHTMTKCNRDFADFIYSDEFRDGFCAECHVWWASKFGDDVWFEKEYVVADWGGLGVVVSDESRESKSKYAVRISWIFGGVSGYFWRSGSINPTFYLRIYDLNGTLCLKMIDDVLVVENLNIWCDSSVQLWVNGTAYNSFQTVYSAASFNVTLVPGTLIAISGKNDQ